MNNSAERIVNLYVQEQRTSTGSTQIGITSTSSSTTSSSSSEMRLDQLLTAYSSMTEITSTFNYDGNRYPEANMPTGGDPTSFNLDIQRIITSQATTSAANRNQISYDDMNLRAASERHQNSVKAITNLLAIIDQARANKNQALLDIELYNQALKEAKAKQRQTQEAIIQLEIKIQQITSAINGLTSNANGIQDQIDALEREKEGLMMRSR